jgi:DNA-binding response OmpR family regulator
LPTILIAEDDLLVAYMLEQTVLQAGYRVCGIARTVSEGVKLGALHRPALAIIDVRLADGGFGTEIIAELRGGLPALGVLYATATANTGSVQLTSVDGHACLGKPYSGRDLVQALKLVEALVGGRAALPPFPVRFQLLTEPTLPHPRGGANG